MYISFFGFVPLLLIVIVAVKGHAYNLIHSPHLEETMNNTKRITFTYHCV